MKHWNKEYPCNHYDTCLHYFKISQLLFVTIAYPPIKLLYNILPHPPTFYYPKKSKKKSRSGIATPNRHFFLLLFIFTFNLRSVQEDHQQCSIFKNLDVVQCFQHEVRIHLRQRLCPIGIFYELLRPITFQ